MRMRPVCLLAVLALLTGTASAKGDRASQLRVPVDLPVCPAAVPAVWDKGEPGVIVNLTADGKIHFDPLLAGKVEDPTLDAFLVTGGARMRVRSPDELVDAMSRLASMSPRDPDLQPAIPLRCLLRIDGAAKWASVAHILNAVAKARYAQTSFAVLAKKGGAEEASLDFPLPVISSPLLHPGDKPPEPDAILHLSILGAFAARKRVEDVDAWLRATGTRTLQVSVDGDVSYSAVAATLNACVAAGVKNVEFAATGGDVIAVTEWLPQGFQIPVQLTEASTAMTLPKWTKKSPAIVVTVTASGKLYSDGALLGLGDFGKAERDLGKPLGEWDLKHLLEFESARCRNVMERGRTSSGASPVCVVLRVDRNARWDAVARTLEWGGQTMPPVARYYFAAKGGGAFRIDLPRDSGASGAKQPPEVHIERVGKGIQYTFQGTAYRTRQKLAAAVKAAGDHVLVSAPVDLHFGDVLALLDAVRGAGVGYLRFAGVPLESKGRRVSGNPSTPFGGH